MSGQKKKAEEQVDDYSPQFDIQEILCFEPTGMVSLAESILCLQKLDSILRAKQLCPIWFSSGSREDAPPDRMYVAYNPIYYETVKKCGHRLIVCKKRALQYHKVGAIPRQASRRKKAS